MPARFKITIEYDGTGLLGWQRQLDGPSVQEYIETAIYKFSSQIVEVHGSGRTDAGVHALGQVAHFDFDTDMDEFKLREALNAHLKIMEAKIAILEVEKVQNDFNARFDTVKRSYIYRILNRRASSPLRENRVWHINYPLDIEKMKEAGRHLLGHHDFSSFRAAACQAKSPEKTLDIIEITKEGDEIVFYFEAKSFLHHQVRNMVGTLKMAGDKSITPKDVKTILEAKDRTKAGITAPACGLYFKQVWY
ncbi:MAG: tRNA pseudouridine(38-40) synthase TruA [Lactobacillaceae bacterium]|jgi:tRNA pseudouridine38-40 synthase|nr:tRNA pseudouridine(38-40) synthase TruA [Lactobacillaceae bacterium]